MTGPAHPDRPAPERAVRLHKVLAEAGVASRRACERLIAEGAVEVNGTPVTTLPAWVDPARDRITVKGRRVRPATEQVYVMLFKPRGVECTNAPEPGRRRAIDLVDHPCKLRLFPVGRLDVDSSGLLILTNDGELANLLTHPRYHLPKIYEVLVRGLVDEASAERLREGMYLNERSGHGARTVPAGLKILKRDRGRTRLLVELREGRNRQIRRVMAHLGHPVKRLRRVQVGPLRLKGLRVGEWRELTRAELSSLKRAAHPTNRPAR